MQTITPFLWFDGQAEDAATLYTSLFEDAAILETRRTGSTGGNVMSVTFRLAGREYIAFNGGPHFTFSPAISLFVSCETQAEVDKAWETLSTGGERQRCGWLKDRYGVSWQVVPRLLGELLGGRDPAGAGRVFQAMMAMSKLDIAGLQGAYDAA